MRFDIKRRLLYLAIGAITFVSAFTIGGYTNVDKNEEENLREQVDKQTKDINQFEIFINNFRISLLMFAPAVGTGIGIFTGFHTGLTFKVILESSPLLNNVSPLATLATPYGAIEVIAYALAISRSGILIYQIAKSQWREYIISTIIEIAIVTVILFIGAIVEWYIIEQFGVTNRLEYFLPWSS